MGTVGPIVSRVQRRRPVQRAGVRRRWRRGIRVVFVRLALRQNVAPAPCAERRPVAGCRSEAVIDELTFSVLFLATLWRRPDAAALNARLRESTDPRRRVATTGRCARVLQAS